VIDLVGNGVWGGWIVLGVGGGCVGVVVFWWMRLLYSCCMFVCSSCHVAFGAVGSTGGVVLVFG